MTTSEKYAEVYVSKNFDDVLAGKSNLETIKLVAKELLDNNTDNPAEYIESREFKVELANKLNSLGLFKYGEILRWAYNNKVMPDRSVGFIRSCFMGF